MSGPNREPRVERCPLCNARLEEGHQFRDFESEIMTMAARFSVQRRVIRKGGAGRPKKLWTCQWCGAQTLGLTASREHERLCARNPENAAKV